MRRPHAPRSALPTRQARRDAHRLDPAPRLVGHRIARFRDPAFANQPDPPFPAYLKPLAPGAALPPGFPVRPLFFHSGAARIVSIPIAVGTSLYGTGEHAGPLLRNGARKTCWNFDAYGYDDSTPSLYQSHPWVLALRPDGTAFGVICETTYRCEIDLRRGITFRTNGPAPAVTIIDRDSPQDVLRALAELTGFMPLPPRWALAYHQCRYSYFPERRVREIAREFRERRIPCGVLWLDIDYMRGYRCFTFDPRRFPNPARLNADLHRQGFRTVWMIDPGLKVDPRYSVYAEAKKGDHFVKLRDGTPFVGRVWPGDCSFPDFTRERTRRWWAGLYRDFLRAGIDGVWNDMNEPAVFAQPGKTMPPDARHDPDPLLLGPLADRSHARFHNLYGMLMARATREGIAAARPDRRPFVLTRANFLGGHRLAATWTGDNSSSWDHLRWSISMVLSLGLSGQPFSGPDIGGFSKNASPELFARWMGLGALLPFARGHADAGTNNKEPWAFGPAVEHTCRVALERRARLLPYLYTCFRRAGLDGLPILRPLFFLDPADPALRSVETDLLLGPDLLVRSAPDPLAPPRTPLPAGWKELFLDDERNDDLPKLFLRPGAVLPVGPVVQHAEGPAEHPLTLFVNPGPEGDARGELYEDAGDGFGFEHGEYRLVRFVIRRRGGLTLLSNGSIEGRWGPRPCAARVVIL